jgi:sulfotransferase family protein
MRQWKRIARAYEIVARHRAMAHKPVRTFGDRVGMVRMWFEYQFMPHYFAQPPRWRIRLRKRNRNRALPDFASVGAIKSGTSDLSTYLLQHPSIMLPLAKEVATTNPDYWRSHYPTLEECARVEREQGKALNGYFGPFMHNLELMDALRRIRPNAKIIILVRDPVERAYSQWKWELFLGGPRTIEQPYFATFDAYVRLALELYPDVRLPTRCGCPMLDAGIYTKAARLWQERFGTQNVLIVHAGDFFRAPVETTCEIHRFLDIEPVPPTVTEVVNRNPLKASPIEPQTAELLKDFYRPHNAELYLLIGRDLGWG